MTTPRGSGSGPRSAGVPALDDGTLSSATDLHSCEKLMRDTGLLVSAVYGLRSGIQCRRVDAAGVGNQSVKDLGVLDAVDVWGNIGLGYELCFPQLGRIIFLDAATSPRSVIDIKYGIRDGFTCASMDRAGTVVLVSAPVTAAPLSHCCGSSSGSAKTTWHKRFRQIRDPTGQL